MNPYENLPEKSFWRPSVADKSLFDISDLWTPKFNLNENHNVATFGSCFAQHIGRALKSNGYKWFIPEVAPAGLSEENKKRFNYDIFSCRTGNIYTTSLLKQWVEWSLEIKSSPNEHWVKGERIYDPFRPNIEPNGFSSVEEMQLSRKETINSFKEVIEKSHFFIFTLGLTESWFNKENGYEYPMCPGTVAGDFNENLHEFRNQQSGIIQKNLLDAIELMKGINPKLKIILTVSPVPLTATYSDNHVLVATMHSKSILRAVAGQLSINKKFIDYFPSYEIINSPSFKGIFFEPNQRSVNPSGVAFVMKTFFKNLIDKFGPTKHITKNRTDSKTQQDQDDVICEEELLEAFGSKK